MADNYLENKMEEYRKSAATKPAPLHRKGFLSVRFPQRRVLVTGGASGIGREIVSRFGNAGCKVAFFDNDVENGKKTTAETGARFIPVDLRNTEDTELAMKSLYETWGDVDIIVNNAGVFGEKDILDTEIKDFENTLAVNLLPVFVLSKSLASHRQSLPYPNSFGGRIINISSTRHIQSESRSMGYDASKGAIASLTRSLMMAMSPLGITVNTISPGWILTNPNEPTTDADRMQHPSGRIGTPADIARLCLFLSLPDNNFINGADIVIDGGMTSKMIYV